VQGVVLRVLVSFEQVVVGLGRDAALRVALENDGNEAATGIALRLALPRGSARLVSGDAACSGSQPLECTLAPLGPGVVAHRLDRVSKDCERVSRRR
jgi:hypothetical protein